MDAKEVSEIVEALGSLRGAGKRIALVHLIKVEGSFYRRAGARVLITESGATVGGVSAGCLEAELIARAREAIARNRAVTVRYDMTAPEDTVWGFGLGCGGAVELLIEPCDLESTTIFFERVQATLRTGMSASVATILDEGGNATARLAFLDPEGRLVSNGVSSDVADRLCRALSAAAGRSECESVTVAYRSDEVRLFVERIQPPPRLMVCGAGADVPPVIRLAGSFGWIISVAVSRDLDRVRERFAGLPIESIVDARRLPESNHHPRTAVLLMSHNYIDDLEILRRISQIPPAYVGLLGPRERAERLLRDLRKEGIVVDPVSASWLHAPVGLDLGAETPEEVALSIVAEIQAVFARREGVFLRNRRGSIHARDGQVAPEDPPRVACEQASAESEQNCTSLVCSQ